MATEHVPTPSRRALLGGVLGGLVATALGGLGRPQPAAATTSDPVEKNLPNATTAPTSVTNSTADSNAFVASAAASGAGLYGSSASGNGAYGGSTDGDGVHGDSTNGAGVSGTSYNGTYGVFGFSISKDGVYGQTQSGVGVWGTSAENYGAAGVSSSTTIAGLMGRSEGNNTGVLGHSGSEADPVTPKKTGVYGWAGQDTASVGVRGQSTTGRGGMFGGKLAQLRLSPSTATTHPSSGAKGDFFVDKSGRLWFCKGGTAWRQLA